MFGPPRLCASLEPSSRETTAPARIRIPAPETSRMP